MKKFQAARLVLVKIYSTIGALVKVYIYKIYNYYIYINLFIQIVG